MSKEYKGRLIPEALPSNRSFKTSYLQEQVEGIPFGDYLLTDEVMKEVVKNIERYDSDGAKSLKLLLDLEAGITE
jgi:hypothetical protein